MNFVAVHFENESLKYTFATEYDNLKLEQPVIVDTASGHELAYVASLVMDESEAKLPKDKEIKNVIRIADDSDIKQYESNKEAAKKAMQIVSKCVEQCDLEMDLVATNYNLDRSKILITYVAEHRVDFRELLKILNTELRCRVELRQIAIRQRAKFIGGIGPCGRALCCATFLNDFQSVSINLAKNQGLSLNASKLTGQCGKLKCCLRYEDDLYTELNQGLPKLNSWVEYEGEKFKVASMNLLSNYVRLDNPLKSKMITVDELREFAVPTQRLTKKAISEIKENSGHRIMKDVTVSQALKDSEAAKEAQKGSKPIKATPSSYVSTSVSENKEKHVEVRQHAIKGSETRVFKTKDTKKATNTASTTASNDNSGNKRVFVKKKSGDNQPVAKASASSKQAPVNKHNNPKQDKHTTNTSANTSNSSNKRTFKKKQTGQKETIRIIEEHEAE